MEENMNKLKKLAAFIPSIITVCAMIITRKIKTHKEKSG